MTVRLLARRRVVLSYGMGADSAALLLRWIHEPGTRPCNLADLLVITAMTGDEWPASGRLTETWYETLDVLASPAASPISRRLGE